MPRKLERFPISLHIVLEWSSGRREARISDLSMGGCFIDTIANVREGEIVNFKLSLNTGHWETIYGEVVYVLPGFGFGIRFTKLSPGQQRILEQIIVGYGGQPWAPPDAASEHQIVAQAVETKRPRRVLVIDGQTESWILIKKVLEAEGYESVVVGDVQAAYEVLQNDTEFTGAILSVVRPDFGELNLIRYMKNETKVQHVPVAIVTSNPDPRIWREGIVAGADMFLPKPFNPDQIRYMLNVLKSCHED